MAHDDRERPARDDLLENLQQLAGKPMGELRMIQSGDKAKLAMPVPCAGPIAGEVAD
jgi:hypothetical protein